MIDKIFIEVGRKNLNSTKKRSIIIKLKNGNAIIRDESTNFRCGVNFDTTEQIFLLCTNEETYRIPMDNIEEVRIV